MPSKTTTATATAKETKAKETKAKELRDLREQAGLLTSEGQEPRRMFEDRPLSKLERRFMETFEAAARVRPSMPNAGKRQLDDAILRFIEVVEGGRGGPGLRQQWFWPGETAQEG